MQSGRRSGELHAFGAKRFSWITKRHQEVAEARAASPSKAEIAQRRPHFRLVPNSEVPISMRRVDGPIISR
jgi:hypothetical protein